MPDQENRKTVASPPGDRPLPLEELLELFEVDTNIWTVERYITNSWPIGIKAEKKDLTWTDGKIEGTVESSGEIATKRLFQTKAWLVKKVLDPLTISLCPVSVTVDIPKIHKPKRASGRTAIILPDPQFGFAKDINLRGAIAFHHRAAIDAALQIAVDYGVDDVVWAGDILDLSEWSTKFLVRPEFQMTTQAALVEASWTIGRFVAALPKAEHTVMLGNHDDRFEKYLINHMGQAYGIRPGDQIDLGPIMAIDNLLGLPRMGVNYIGSYPDGELWLNKNLKVVHGKVVRARAGSTAAAMVDNSVVNQVFGHIHRRELATRKVVEMSKSYNVFAATPGCLCHTDGRVPGSSPTSNWQVGALFIKYMEDGWVGAPEMIEFDNNGNAYFRGNIYLGHDTFDELVEMTGDAFDWRTYAPL